eukprot:403350578
MAQTTKLQESQFNQQAVHQNTLQQLSNYPQNVVDWQIQDVCKFLSNLLPKKQLEITKQIIKHQINGIDLLEMTEKNMLEIGITIIHERKKIMRQIKMLKNLPSNSNNCIIVKYFDVQEQHEKLLKFKITENVKVKHILQQAYQIFRQKKCDLSQNCLVQVSAQETKVLLSNNTLIADIITSSKIQEFQICKTAQFTHTQAISETRSACSPIRLIRNDIENSLERLVSSPTQTIYVQPIDDNDEVMQLNQSNSDCPMQLNTYRQSTRNESKSSSKNSHLSNIKLSKKTRLIQQSINATNMLKDQGVNASTANYLQNYITSNRQSHKKQPSNSTSNILPITNFQLKKHSVNETAFSYTGGPNSITSQTLPHNQANTGTNSTNSNTGCLNSLSRGNSMKKMKTFCNGQPIQQSNMVNSNGSSSHQIVANFKSNSGIQNNGNYNNHGANQNIPQGQISINAKQTKKVVHKNGKSVNMYQTLNGTNNHQTIGVKKSSIHNKENIKQQVTTQKNQYVKIHNEDFEKQKKSDNTPAKSRQTIRENQMHTNQSKPNGQGNDKQQINNLNEIFSDFLDEQSQLQTASINKQKLHQRVRAESLHSRQQVLLEEDSLESTKRQQVDQYHAYMQTEQSQTQGYDSNSYTNMPNQQQRAIKHMAHKSMYALNSNQIKESQKKKSLGGDTGIQKNQNNQFNQQHFGTFDNSQIGLFNNNLNQNYHQYAVTSMSDCGGNENFILQENYDLAINNDNNLQNIQPQLCHNGYSNNQSSRMNTEIDIISNKENVQFQRETFEGLGKRGGTLGYGRSDSNPTKHRNNRYSDQCDDLLMMDMSEEESVLINKKQ